MIRPAHSDDIMQLNKLIEHSARILSDSDYTNSEIEGAIHAIFGVDKELINDQTYYVIEKNEMLIACGGWSKRKTLFGGDQCKVREEGFLDPQKDYAKIRAFFVHPNYARQGLGRKLLEYCEQQALAHGFTKFEMMATLPGAKLYQVCGYQMIEPKYFVLPNNQSFKMLKMTKHII